VGKDRRKEEEKWIISGGGKRWQRKPRRKWDNVGRGRRKKGLLQGREEC